MEGIKRENKPGMKKTPAKLDLPEPDEDVIGLKIPRKRILTTFDVNLDVRTIPRRKPHVAFDTNEEEEEL